MTEIIVFKNGWVRFPDGVSLRGEEAKKRMAHERRKSRARWRYHNTKKMKAIRGLMFVNPKGGKKGEVLSRRNVKDILVFNE